MTELDSHPNGWVKYFLDGTTERGDDEAVGQKLASWSKGRLSGMEGVSICYNGVIAAIFGEGEFWQSDDWSVPLFISEGELFARRISKKITEDDKAIVFYLGEDSYCFRFVDEEDESFSEEPICKIEDEHVDSSFQVLLDLEEGYVRWSIAEQRL